MPTDSRRENQLAYLGELAGGLAHEIKNPLSTLKINFRLLRDESRGGDDPRTLRTLRRLETCEREVERLERIVNDFLRFARPRELKLEPTRLNDVVEETLYFLEPEFRQHGIQLRRLFTPDLPFCPMERSLFQQALLNVLVNARQAMEGRGGELMVRTLLEGDFLALDVIDTGEGIPPDRLPRIFQPYFSTKQGGTGLGLPTARRIIEDHGGTITVTSEPGKGTAVRVRLRTSAAGALAPGPPPG
jgi:signal transduction histidine kinase